MIITMDVQIQCPHCGKSNIKGNFVCDKCGNLLDIPPVEKQTRMLAQTRNLDSLQADYFDQHSTLVLRLRHQEKSFQLTSVQLELGQVIGRNASRVDQKAQIDLTRYEGEVLGVSRCHARLCYDSQNKTVRVSDLDSANGTYINGQKLHPGEVRVLRHGDRLRIGKLEMGVTILHASAVVDVF
ncbi:MAG: hypothetical protein CL610_22970 [Anaerolineaceae bacterium]|nr:hypothetical protein [Anaerolineaceae bacterium]